MLYNGVWGTICSDGWNVDNAEVVCRTLGFSGASTFFSSSSQYGRGSDPIWLDNVMCNGNEASLVECTYPGVGIIEDCTHDKDVGVRCSGFQGKDNLIVYTYACINDQLLDVCGTLYVLQFEELICHLDIPVRLVGSGSHNEGRVEVNYNGEWGTVCDDGWDDTDAGVVCRQLGFGSSGTAVYSASFGQGSGPILLSSVTCSGNEASITNCLHLGLHIISSCSHSEDAGVICSGIIGMVVQHIYKHTYICVAFLL